jgi:hypothetical protein
MQADFLLFIREAADALKAGKHNRWSPNSLVFSTRRAHPFEMFARAQSRRYFETIKGVLGVEDKPNLETLLQAFGPSLYLPRWQFDQLEPQVLIGVDRIATLP